MNIEVRQIDRAGFEAMSVAWTELLQRATHPMVFMTWEWAASWLKSYGASARCVLLGAWREDRLIALLPLHHTAGGVLEFWGVSDLEPDGVDLIAEPGAEADVLVAMLDYLSRQVPGWRELKLDALSARSALLGALPALRTAAFVVVEQPNICPAALLKGSFREYLDSVMKPKHRQDIERRLRAVSQKHGLELRRVETSEALPAALDDLFRLHTERKADRGVETRFQGALTEKFHRELAARALEQGWLALYGLYQGDRAVCMLYCFQYANRMFAYQSGLDPEWSKVGLGSAILQLVLKDSLERGLTRMDLSRGPNQYKLFIANEITHNHTLRLYRRTFPGVVRWSAHRAITKARGYARVLRQRLRKPEEQRA